MKLQFFAIASLAQVILSSAHSSQLPVPAPVRVIAELDQNGTWFENIEVRSNGAILVTQLEPEAQLYQISPTKAYPPLLVASFPSKAALGIQEIRPDVFAVLTNNFSTSSGASGLNTNTFWQVDLRGLSNDRSCKQSVKKVKVRRLVDVPEAEFLNGVDSVPDDSEILLATDSTQGVVYRINTRSKQARVVHRGPLFDPTPGDLIVGANGLKVRGNAMFWSNSNKQLLGRVRIDGQGLAVGKYENLTAIGQLADDFAVGPVPRDQLFVATNGGNSIVRVRKDEVVTVVGGGTSPLVAGGTSIRFARGKLGKRGILYVATDGGALSLVEGGRVGAKVVEVDVSKWL